MKKIVYIIVALSTYGLQAMDLDYAEAKAAQAASLANSQAVSSQSAQSAALAAQAVTVPTVQASSSAQADYSQAITFIDESDAVSRTTMQTSSSAAAAQSAALAAQAQVFDIPALLQKLQASYDQATRAVIAERQQAKALFEQRCAEQLAEYEQALRGETYTNFKHERDLVRVRLEFLRDVKLPAGLESFDKQILQAAETAKSDVNHALNNCHYIDRGYYISDEQYRVKRAQYCAILADMHKSFEVRSQAALDLYVLNDHVLRTNSAQSQAAQALKKRSTELEEAYKAKTSAEAFAFYRLSKNRWKQIVLCDVAPLQDRLHAAILLYELEIAAGTFA